jgi:hypothetical protein
MQANPSNNLNNNNINQDSKYLKNKLPLLLLK